MLSRVSSSADGSATSKLQPPATMEPRSHDGMPGPCDLDGARILVIMPSIPLEGMERSTIQIMRMLRERGADVLCVTERDYGQRVSREVERAGCDWTAISCHKRLRLTKNPLEMWKMLRHSSRCAWAIRRIIKRYRPTHIHVTNPFFFLLAWPALVLGRRPVVFRVPNPPPTDLSRFKQALSNAIWRRALVARADAIVCNSQYTLSVLQNVAPTRKAVVINNCLPERARHVPSDAPVVDPNRFNVAYVGRVRPAKGADHLIEAAIRLIRSGVPADFYLAGEHRWQNPFADSMVQRVEQERLSSRVRFLGHIEDVFGLLEQCDLHVHPALAEPFGNALLEAKHCSLPSVVFPGGEPPNIVRHGVDGYVCREISPAALCDGIRYFYDDRQALHAARAAARASLERFSTERAAESWAELYKRLR